MSKQNISWRNHYVPQFFIRDFSGSDKLYGYNKFTKSFLN